MVYGPESRDIILRSNGALNDAAPMMDTLSAKSWTSAVISHEGLIIRRGLETTNLLSTVLGRFD
jgi:hypothetical protein